jgi:hypothetical protein
MTNAKTKKIVIPDTPEELTKAALRATLTQTFDEWAKTVVTDEDIKLFWKKIEDIGSGEIEEG